MKEIQIRKSEIGDIDSLVAFLGSLFSIEKDFPISPDRQRAGLQYFIETPEDRVIFVAEHDENIIGMVTGQLVVSTAMGGHSILVEDMFVIAQQRRRGIGSKLFEAVLAWGVEKGALRVQLVADIANKGALLFYRKAGLLRSRMTALYGSLEGGTVHGT